MMTAEDAAGGDVEDPRPAAPPQDAPPSTGASATKADPNKKAKVFALALFLVVALVLAIALGTTLPNRGDDASKAVPAGEGGEDPTAVEPIEDVTDVIVEGAEGAEDTTAPGTDETSPEEIDIEEVDPTSDETSPEEINDEGVDDTPDATPIVYQARYLAPKGPIASRVRMLDPSAADGYDSCDDLREDMLNALHHYASTLIARETENDWYLKCDPNANDQGRDQVLGVAFDIEPEIAFSQAEGAPLADADTSLGAAAAPPPEDGFETNNQVEGVDEADIVKSDGEHVFAAYGDLLYAWDARDGTQGVSITPMEYEKVNETECTYEPYYNHYYYGRPGIVIDEPIFVLDEEDGETVSISAEDTVSISIEDLEEDGDADEGVRGRNLRDRPRRKDLSIAPGFWNPCRQSKPKILSLLLEGTRLTAIVSQDQNYLQYYRSEEEDDDSPPSVVQDNTKLTIRVFDVSNVPNDGTALTLLGEKDITGNYESARSIDDTGLVVTTNYVNTYLFAQDLYRSSPQYCGLNATEYETLAVETALNKTEAFVDRMLDDLKFQLDGTCDSIFQVGAMQSGDDEDQTNGDLLNRFVRVMSFDMSSDFGDEKEITTNVAGAFSAGWLSSVYASQGFVATLSQGSNYNANTSKWESSTFIQGFDITGATPKPLCYAEIPGRPGLWNSPYAADLYQGHFRMVTTESSWSSGQGFETVNRIYILKVPRDGEGNEMVQTAATEHLGKPREQVEAVRYIGPKAYVVTFERTDPFYIYDLSDPYDPKQLGELEVPGFSSYLHPIVLDGVDLMLGVGVHVDEETQRRVGLKISLYDISDATNPTENATYIDEDAYSSSGTDFKAFRFLPQSKKLILPKREYFSGDDGNFDGFVVYDVSLGSIRPSYDIEHASGYTMSYGCWYSASMPARSLVFQSKVTTILSHSVISTDLGSGERLWNLTLGDGLAEDDCGPYWF